MAEQNKGEPNPSFTVPLLINGNQIRTETVFPVISPLSHKAIWSSSSASLEDVKAAIDAAQNAFIAWSAMRPAAKRAIFLRAAEIFDSRSEDLGKYVEMEIGCTGHFSQGMIKSTSEMLRDVAGRLGSIMGYIPPTAEEGTMALVEKEPFGVVLGIAPWNAPYVLGMRSIIYPLAGGNTCILKGSELCPRVWSAMGQVLSDAGLPVGVLNILVHQPKDAAEITTALIESPGIKKINFTGSTAVGRIISSQAGKNLKPVLMELGGKANAIVLEDADIRHAAVQCALGAFLGTGQICMSSERILVHKDVKIPFVEAFKAATQAIFGGEADPALVAATPAAIERTKRLIDNAVAAGAKVVYGDHHRIELHPGTGEISKTRTRPIIVDRVGRNMDLYYRETFSPSVSVIEISSDEEAIEIANDTEYGLTASVFTSNLSRGLRVAKRIETGAVHINSMTVHDECTLPHGGAKASGFGRFNGNWGIDEFMRLKTITYQR